jgi:PilZ domain-containing protein
MRWFRWSGKSKERRRAKRTPVDSLAAVYWDGSVSCTHIVKDVSLTGARIETGLNWAVGTLIRISLHHLGKGISGPHNPLEPAVPAERTAEVPGSHEPEPIRNEDVFVDVWSRVVRKTSQGLSVQFLFADRAEAEGFRQFIASKVGEYVKEAHQLTPARKLQRTGAH